MAQIQSAVRVPTPPPEGLHSSPSPSPSPNPRKRKSPPSRSPSPGRRKALRDVDPNRSRERRPSPPAAKPLTDAEKQEMARKEYNTLLEKSRSGGIYIPPARLKALQAALPEDKNSKEYQRMAWDALKKSINGLINKANTGNLRLIVPELFQENLLRGRGIYCNSIMRAQQNSLPYSALFASLSAIITSKLPALGQLLVNRLASRFQKAFKRDDKSVALGAVHFIAHLTNQNVVEPKLVMQMLLLLLAQPTDDSVELAVALLREVGAFLDENDRQLSDLVFGQLRNVLQSSDVEQRTIYSIEVLMQQRKDQWSKNPAVPEGLDLIEDSEKVQVDAPELDEPINVETGLNVFKVDDAYEENEAKWAAIKAEILGEDSDDEDDDRSDDDSEDSEDEAVKQQDIKDMTADELTALRRKIYLTIQSTSNFEEACHKLMKVQLPAGRERELPSMIIETCSQRPTYEKFYGLMGERLCNISRHLQSQFEEEFAAKYETIHRYDTPKLRSIASFFAHLVGTSAIGWHVLSCITLTEADTTSSNRIFIKILFQGIVEEIGVPKLTEKLRDPMMQPSFTGLFPTDHPRNSRFAINYFTSIELGAVTEDLREFLQNMPKPAPPALPAARRSRSPSDSISSYSTGSSYSSRSRSRSPAYSTRSRSRSPSRSRLRSRSDSRSVGDRSRGRPRGRSYTPSRSRSYSSRARSRSYTPIRSRSRTPPRRAPARSRRASTSLSRSRSRSLPRKTGRYTDSLSRSRSPTRSHTPPRRSAPARRRRSYTPSRSRSLSPSRSRSPAPRRSAPGRRRSPSLSISRSRSPPRRTAPARNRSITPPRRRSSSPPRRRAPARDRSASPARRRRYSSSRSPARSRTRSRSPPVRTRSRSPLPRRRGAQRLRSSSRSPVRRAPPPPPPTAQRKRSLSPFSKRVALTKAQRK